MIFAMGCRMRNTALTTVGVATWLCLLCMPGVAGVTASVQPEEVFVGEAATLNIVSDRAVPRDAVLPQIDGLQWLGGARTSQQTNISFGRRTFTGTASYPFRVQREGVFRIAGVKVREKDRMVDVPDVEIIAKQRRFTGSRGEKLTMADVLRVEAGYVGHGRGAVRAYLGEEVPLLIEVFAATQLRPNFGYPTLEVENAVIKDYSAQNPDSSQFARGTVTTRIDRGIRFKVASFTTALTPLADGRLTAGGNVLVAIALQNAEEDYFNDLFRMRTSPSSRRQLTFQLPPLDVLPRPPVPGEAGSYLGLVGDWTVTFQLSNNEVRVGEALTLTMRIRGEGGTAGFTAPELDVPNCRSYDPEVDRVAGDNQITVTWALIPLSVEADTITLTVCTLNPESGKYDSHSFSGEISVTPGQDGIAGNPIFDPNGARDTGRGAGVNGVSSLLYIKDRAGRGVALPLWRNAVIPAGSLVGIGAVFLIGAVSWRLLGFGTPRSEAELRRQAAMRRRGRVIRQLQRASADELGTLAREQVVPLVVDMWKCPPGTSASELAGIAETRHPELADAIRDIDQGEFAPGGVRGIPDARKLAALIRGLKSLLILGILGLGGIAEADSGQGVKGFTDAVSAYDAGNYRAAEEIFSELGRADAEDPVLLYNRANCAFEDGRPAEALALYERAAMLAPRDSDISENLNFVRIELGLPARGAAQNPGELLAQGRDLLRPDEWLLAGAAWLGAGMVWAGVAVLRRRKWSLPVAIALAGAFVVMAVWRQQMASSYRPGSKAVVANRQTTAYHHPSEEARKTEFVPVYGERVEVIEKRTDWSLVRSPAGEGWVRDEHLATVW